ncbi:MAG: response regulator [Spirulinaceae cyanobacterium RM2_2_10]|nr:response regulator [Spirulinaceae cyanobacterium SM2_1_0]NJO21329.1 response regulator [Spirulinaceae cyanobacterium RM2_2_10]
MNSAAPSEVAIGSVLVVDDTPNNLRLLSELLSDRGYEVRAVIDGNMAIKAAQMRPPDIILLDIKMPGMDGYQVCERLKSDPRTAATPVIFLSAFNESIDRARAFQAGGIDYLNKPIQIEEVLVRLDIHLGRQRWQRRAQQATAALAAIHRLHVQPAASFADRCAASLQIGCELLGSETGWVSQIGGDRCTIQAVQASHEFWRDRRELFLSETPETLVWDTQQTQIAAPLANNPDLSTLPLVQTLQPQAYLGTPLGAIASATALSASSVSDPVCPLRPARF